MSFYCTSQCTAAGGREPGLQSAAVSDTSTSVQFINDDCVAPQQPEDDQLSAEDDDIVTVGSTDSDADNIESSVSEKSQQTYIGGGGGQQQQRPFGFCGALNGRGITVNGGLAYRQLPAAC